MGFIFTIMVMGAGVIIVLSILKNGLQEFPYRRRAMRFFQNQIIDSSAYKKKQSVMSKSESAFFFELQRQLPVGYFIFPKMRVADILDIPNGDNYYQRRNEALPKHVDFLICDYHFKPIVAIELNGNSHNNFKQQLNDRAKNTMFKSSGLILETVNVGESFTESIRRITEDILGGGFSK